MITCHGHNDPVGAHYTQQNTVPRLQVPSPRHIPEATDECFSLTLMPLALSLTLSLSPSPSPSLSEVNKNISSGED